MRKPIDTTIRVVIVEDDDETRDYLAEMFELEPDIRVVGTARNGKEGIEVVRFSHPHIVLLGPTR